jgi:lipoic acid synthetase
LYGRIRPQADYARSVALLKRVRDNGISAKSGFMVGLGETDEDVRELLGDLKAAGCDMVTIGQYMRPSRKHPPVRRYVHPDIFAAYAAWGAELGISHVFSSPLVRSSYQAGESFTASTSRAS